MVSASRIELSATELKQMFAGRWEDEFPPILTAKSAAKLAGLPVATIYDWSSRKLLTECANRRGKRLHIHRDRFVQFLFRSAPVSRESTE